MFSLKMTDDSDASSSILVPFDHKWETQITANSITVFFRKRGPRSFVPNTVYLYIASPASRLIGRATIESFSFMRLEKATKLAPQGGLTETELRYYASRYSELAVFQLAQFEPAPSPLTFAELSSAYTFHPPQSFVRLSASGVTTLDASLGYSKQRTTKSKSQNTKNT